jgi:hypothetical protein
MIPILSAGIFFIPFLLLNKTLSLYQNKDLFSVIVKLLGKYMGICVCLLIFLISSVGISFDTRTYTNIVRTFYFPTTPTFVIYAILMAICTYGAKKGIHHIGSVSYLIIFYFVIFFCMALMLSAQSSSFRSVFPILGPGTFKIIKESVRGLSLFADFFLLTTIIPFVRSRKEARKGTWISYFFITFQLSVAVLVYICLFDMTLGTIGYPFHTLIRFISLGSYLPNVEIIFFVIWLLSAFIRFTVFLYINGMMFGYIFKIKDIEYLIPALAAIYLLIGSMPESSIEIAQSKLVVIAAVGPVFTIISVILWLAAVLRGEFKYAKNRNSI